MKVVLFCGGVGTRLKEYSDTVPKPMVSVGHRPMIWHLMKYYAYYGHKEFILCLGYRGDAMRRYFLDYDECESNDFTITEGGRRVRLYTSDISDWSITFAETGLYANLGQRLCAVRKYLGDDELFLANYTDGLSDLPLLDYLAYARTEDRVATFLCVKPHQSFHIVSLTTSGQVTDLRPANDSSVWINGGFFVFKRQIFDYIKDGEDLVVEPFHRLIREEQLVGYRYRGFWASMDTMKDKLSFDEMAAADNMPWQVWESRGA